MQVKKKGSETSSSSKNSVVSVKPLSKHHIRHHLMHNPPKPIPSNVYDKKLVHESNVFFFGAIAIIFCSLAVLARDIALGAVGLIFCVSIAVEYIKLKKLHKLESRSSHHHN